MADIITILYVLASIVTFMFAIGLCLGIACIGIERLWRFIDQTMLYNLRK